MEAELGELPNNWSAQMCKLFTVNQALRVPRIKKNSLNPDSKFPTLSLRNVA